MQRGITLQEDKTEGGRQICMGKIAGHTGVRTQIQLVHTLEHAPHAHPTPTPIPEPGELNLKPYREIWEAESHPSVQVPAKAAKLLLGENPHI